MKTKMRILTVVLLACFMLIGLAACGHPYHAEILNGQAADLINQEFLDANRTRGAYDNNDETAEGDGFLPSSRAFLVRTQEEYDKIFKPDAAVPVNFERELLVVCTYTSIYVRKVTIEDIEKDRHVLELTLEERHPRGGIAVGDACRPYQRYVIIKLDRTDVTAVDFELDD